MIRVNMLKQFGLIPLTAIGWVLATHISLYRAILIIPLSLLSAMVQMHRPRNCFCKGVQVSLQRIPLMPLMLVNPVAFFFMDVCHNVPGFLLWMSAWSFYVMVLCGISVR